MKLAVVVLFCVFQTLLSSQETNNSGFEHICRVSFRFSKVCYFHDFVSDKSIENGCHPTRLKNCPILRTKVNEPKCPVYICEPTQKKVPITKSTISKPKIDDISSTKQVRVTTRNISSSSTTARTSATKSRSKKFVPTEGSIQTQIDRSISTNQVRSKPTPSYPISTPPTRSKPTPSKPTRSKPTPSKPISARQTRSTTTPSYPISTRSTRLLLSSGVTPSTHKVSQKHFIRPATSRLEFLKPIRNPFISSLTKSTKKLKKIITPSRESESYLPANELSLSSITQSSTPQPSLKRIANIEDYNLLPLSALYSDSQKLTKFVDEMDKTRFERALSAVDCGDRDCVLTYSFQQVCKTYLPTNNTECIIPCKQTGCHFEIHKMVECPLWVCEKHSTTSTSSSTAQPLTTPAGPSDSTTSFAISLFFNVLFLSVVSILFGFFIRKFIIARRQLRNPEYNRPIIRTGAPSDLRFFSLSETSSGRTTPLSLGESSASAPPYSAFDPATSAGFRHSASSQTPKASTSQSGSLMQPLLEAEPVSQGPSSYMTFSTFGKNKKPPVEESFEMQETSF